MTNLFDQSVNPPIAQRFTFHSDPGHAWLEVPLSLIRSLDIMDKITPYSYKTKEKAYLEEDFDAITFIKAYLKSVGKEDNDYGFFKTLIVEKFTSNRSFVRTLKHF
jgi:hypothetical protein